MLRELDGGFADPAEFVSAYKPSFGPVLDFFTRRLRPATEALAATETLFRLAFRLPNSAQPASLCWLLFQAEGLWTGMPQAQAAIGPDHPLRAVQADPDGCPDQDPAILWSAFRGLSLIHREHLALQYWDQLSNTDAAAVLDRRVGTAARELKAARVALTTVLVREMMKAPPPAGTAARPAGSREFSETGTGPVANGLRILDPAAPAATGQTASAAGASVGELAAQVLAKIAEDGAVFSDAVLPPLRTSKDGPSRRKLLPLAAVLAGVAAISLAAATMLTQSGGMGAAPSPGAGRQESGPQATVGASDGIAVQPGPGASRPSPSERQYGPFDELRRFFALNKTVSFDVPAGWYVLSTDEFNGPVPQLDARVFNERGALTAELQVGSISWTVASCSADYQYSALDSAGVPDIASTEKGHAPEFVYRTVQGDKAGDKVTASLGITDGTSSIGSGGGCPQVNVGSAEVRGFGYQYSFADQVGVFPDGTLPINDYGAPLHVFDTMDQARAFMMTDEYQTLKRMLTSLRMVALDSVAGG